jgi:hypothetical protein
MEDNQNQTPVRKQTASRQLAGIQIVLARLIALLGWVISTLLIIRIVLLLLAANVGAPFVSFIYTVSGWFAWPFYGIFSYQPHYEQSVLEISSVVAVVVYSLVAAGLVRLVTLTSGSHSTL